MTSEISGENQEEQKQEEQKEKVQPATQTKASVSTAQVAKATPAATSATTASKTGDINLTALWITLSAVSAGILGAIIIAIKKRRAE